MRTSLVALFVIALAGCGGDPPSPQTQTAAPTLSPAKAPDENAAITAINNINKAQADFFFRNRRYALTYEELKDGFFLKEEPTVANTGYEIKLRPRADGGGYTVLASPSTPSATTRHFFSDQTGTVRAEQGKDANVESPQISP